MTYTYNQTIEYTDGTRDLNFEAARKWAQENGATFEEDISRREKTDGKLKRYFVIGSEPKTPEPTAEEKAAEVRAERDRRIDAIRWRIERYQTQDAAGLETTDTAEHYKAILLYVQALRDIPEQAGFPESIEWPAEPTGESEKTADPVSEITEEESEIEEEAEQP